MSPLSRARRTMDFDRLYRRHVASVYRYAYAVLGNHADAEDVTQQTFLNAYRAIERGTKPRKAENWLLTIAHNEVRRHFRRTLGKPLEVELDVELPDPAAERGEPRLTDVVRALQQLTPAQRSALVMREFEGRSYTNIAEVMGLTPSALEALIFRARRALAEQLDDAFTCAESEQALLRRLDGRLPRREARRLKAHLRECPLCVRFADVQKRQRAVLKGLSIMPIPASLFLFRGEQAAAAGAAAGAGSAATAGLTGVTSGVAAKAAAVTAAAAVAGGVGYGVTAGPASVTRTAEPAAKQAAVAAARTTSRVAVTPPTRARPVAAVRVRRTATPQRRAAEVKIRPRKVANAKTRPVKRVSAALKKLAKAAPATVKVKKTPKPKTRVVHAKTHPKTHPAPPSKPRAQPPRRKRPTRVKTPRAKVPPPKMRPAKARPPKAPPPSAADPKPKLAPVEGPPAHANATEQGPKKPER